MDLVSNISIGILFVQILLGLFLALFLTAKIFGLRWDLKSSGLTIVPVIAISMIPKIAIASPALFVLILSYFNRRKGVFKCIFSFVTFSIIYLLIMCLFFFFYSKVNFSIDIGDKTIEIEGGTPVVNINILPLGLVDRAQEEEAKRSIVYLLNNKFWSEENPIFLAGDNKQVGRVEECANPEYEAIINLYMPTTTVWSGKTICKFEKGDAELSASIYKDKEWVLKELSVSYL